MKLGITISLPGYQNIRLDTNEHPDLKSAIEELHLYKVLLNISEVTEYLERYLNLENKELSD